MKIELSSLIVVLMGLTSSVLAKNHDRYSYGPCTSDNEGAYACWWSNAFGEKHDKVVVCNSGKWETEQKCELYHSCLTEGNHRSVRAWCSESEDRSYEVEWGNGTGIARPGGE